MTIRMEGGVAMTVGPLSGLGYRGSLLPPLTVSEPSSEQNSSPSMEHLVKERPREAPQSIK